MSRNHEVAHSKRRDLLISPYTVTVPDETVKGQVEKNIESFILKSKHIFSVAIPFPHTTWL